MNGAHSHLFFRRRSAAARPWPPNYSPLLNPSNLTQIRRSYYVNTTLLMATVYANAFALVLFALARASTVLEATYSAPAYPGEPPRVEALALQETIKVEHLMQLGTLSILARAGGMGRVQRGLLRRQRLRTATAERHLTASAH